MDGSDWTHHSVLTHSFAFIPPSLALLGSLSDGWMDGWLCWFKCVSLRLENRCVHSLSFYLSLSLCLMWFVVCSKLELCKDAHYSQHRAANQEQSEGAKKKRERESERKERGSRWRREAAKLLTGAEQSATLAFLLFSH